MGILITKPQLVKQFSDGAIVGFVKEDIHDWQIFNKKTEKLEGVFTHKVLQGSK